MPKLVDQLEEHFAQLIEVREAARPAALQDSSDLSSESQQPNQGSPIQRIGVFVAHVSCLLCAERERKTPDPQPKISVTKYRAHQRLYQSQNRVNETTEDLDYSYWFPFSL